MFNRHFVFLQGMPCHFFSEIAERLTALGCKTTAIALCAGDRLFWRGRYCVNYRGRLTDWPQFIDDFYRQQGVTDLVLLGEQRRYHREAISLAQNHGIRVSVTDFGYLRPDWMTLERDGMSGQSHFPKHPTEILRLAANLPAPDLNPHYQDSALNMAVGDLTYSFSSIFGGFLYPHYQRSDNRPHPLIYFPAMGWKLWQNHRLRPQQQYRTQAFIAQQKRYFLFPMQLAHDFQIVAYSPFERMDDALKHVINSFAAHADCNDNLIFKPHPWDPGLRNWKSLIKTWAHQAGVAQRVDYLEGGDLDALIQNSLGVVTVNSTSGIRALQLGKPLKILGQAVYDIEGLVDQAPLASFWQTPHAPNRELLSAFIKLMAASIQIRGVFFNRDGRAIAVRTAVERLYHQQVGEFT